jgi:hypothetical protein
VDVGLISLGQPGRIQKIVVVFLVVNGNGRDTSGSVHSRSKGENSTWLELARITHTAGDASVKQRHVKRKQERHLVLKTSRLETKTASNVRLGDWDSFLAWPCSCDSNLLSRFPPGAASADAGKSGRLRALLVGPRGVG